MLDPNEKAVFDGMVTRLCAGDPRLAQRLDRLGRPRRRSRTILAYLLWMTAPACVIVGGWTGLFMGLVAAGYGVSLYRRRDAGSHRHESPVRRS